MRLSNTSSLFSVTLLAAWLVGCGGGSSAADGGNQSSCKVELTGNTTDRAGSSSCVLITNATDVDGDAAGLALSVDTQIAAFGRLTASIDLGSALTIGQLTSESGMSWNVSAQTTTSPACTFQAGSAIVPNGSFTLRLTSLDMSKKTAHGTLTFITYLHASEETDCGDGDIENISVQF